MVVTPGAVILVVVAHPDDEALGFGGTARVLSERGHTIHSAILVGDADARLGHPGVSHLHADTDAAHEILGMEPPIRGPFPNIRMNNVPHLDLVQFIEGVIEDTRPDIVVTVHPGDVNDDHRQTSRACQAAVRLPQRQPSAKPIDGLLFMEVLSSTDWSVSAGGQGYRPQMYVEIGEHGLEAKLAALARYSGVMRDYPHPRSEPSVRSLATLRGSDAGLHLAEAFEVGFLHSRHNDVDV